MDTLQLSIDVESTHAYHSVRKSYVRFAMHVAIHSVEFLRIGISKSFF